MRLIDLSGQTFGRLKVIDRNISLNRKTPHWNCECICGKNTVVYGGHLKNGRTISCGCYKKEKMTTHGLSHETRLFSIWVSMIDRCNNKSSNAFSCYGERGICVCYDWKVNVESFFLWAHKNGYNKKLEIDRIDNNGDYCPENCRWVTKKVNARNRRTNRIIEFRGEKKCLIEWSEIFKINQTTLRCRIDNGWSIKDALLKPVHKRCCK